MSKSDANPGPAADVLDFDAIGRLPMPGDNAAIAIRELPPGTRFRFDGGIHELSHTVLEGHRFAVAPLDPGQELLSWNLPFGRTLRSICPGEYLCNARMLDALRIREPDFELPAIANFQDARARFELDERVFRPGEQLPSHDEPRSFEGYTRTGDRGTGTRNDIVVLATNSSATAFVNRLAVALKADVGDLPNVDDIVPVTHTEGGTGTRTPNNLEFVLRTLAGFLVHPNVAAILAVDVAGEVLDNARLREYLIDNGYPLQHVLHSFYTLTHDIDRSLADCARVVRDWYPEADRARRQPSPLADLRIALQCGGSDAFSGISGNPLAARVAREVIRHGGAANLAETDELIGAESYVLANARNLDVAREFLARIDVFRERLAWHGQSAEGNPSGGNLFRGLYNISLKSIGAARKKDPDVRLDHVIDYASRMEHPGFHFMDSPGNDLESIAGQVAAGCNLIFFITGNGSITNFPFVPTIKFVTTTRRWELLSRDMDVNAGRYVDGESIDVLGDEIFDLAVRVASGARSAGERAGHSQVSIWRDWCQSDASQLARLQREAAPDGKPLATAPDLAHRRSAELYAGLRKVGLILPTSLCSGQIALKIAGELNARLSRDRHGLSRFVALAHTEGCGASSGENEDHYLRTAVGHLVHPMVGAALLLEHGCERTHNDLMRHSLNEYDVDPERFGYASIQLDGGIDAVVDKVVKWFAGRPDPAAAPPGRDAAASESPTPISLGLTASGPVPGATARALGGLSADIVASGGSVVISRNASLTDNPAFLDSLGLEAPLGTTLDYGQVARVAGLHVMATPAANFVETVTGLGGTGAHVILAHVSGRPLQGHPMIPTLQIAPVGSHAEEFEHDLDCLIDDRRSSPDEIVAELERLIRETTTGEYAPSAWSRGYTNFQLTRGMLGVSL